MRKQLGFDLVQPLIEAVHYKLIDEEFECTQ